MELDPLMNADGADSFKTYRKVNVNYFDVKKGSTTWS